jgi:hypothetical protein
MKEYNLTSARIFRPVHVFKCSQEKKKFKGLGGLGAGINRLSVWLSVALFFRLYKVLARGLKPSTLFHNSFSYFHYIFILFVYGSLAIYNIFGPIFPSYEMILLYDSYLTILNSINLFPYTNICCISNQNYHYYAIERYDI